MPIPSPLTKGHICPECNGTGADIKRTKARDRKDANASGYVSCWACNGNGLDPAAYFSWSDK